ncbi:MAG: cysteine dioxygenase family protein [Chloroflexota bacterium]
MSLEGKYQYEDEWLLEAPELKTFIDKVNEIRTTAESPESAVAQIRPYFATLLNDPNWLPEKYQLPAEGESGMGGKTGMWLLYRSGDGGLAFSALVLAPGTKTPVHNHLAWGLVGLYKGLQSEVVFDRTDDGSKEGFADLAVKETNELTPGDFYELMPENDIHQVETTSEFTSVSLHLLGNDNGCIWRNRFDPDDQAIAPFKSGWLNTECREYSSVHPHDH